jgi:hypothetical protein
MPAGDVVGDVVTPGDAVSVPFLTRARIARIRKCVTTRHSSPGVTPSA